MSDREDNDKAEQASAEALRRALDGESRPANDVGDKVDDADDLAELAESLRAAYDPKALSPKDHEEIISRAIPARSRSNVIRVTFGVVSAMAIAAALILYIGQKPQQSMKDNAPIAWARSRSTAPLFSEPLKAGQAAARIDRIALAREHDFRENRFAARLTKPERSR